MKNPEISVIMPVYNSELFLAEAIESILNQTFKDFEFLIFNDGSTDNSLKILEEYAKKDSRIKIFNSPDNKGYVYHLNQGIKIAKGEYIARMDSDDISDLKRFSKQIKVIKSNPKLAVVGGSVLSIDKFGNKTGKWILKATPEETHVHFLFTNYVIHPSVLIRKSMIPEGAYDEKMTPAEDFDLWTKILDENDIYSIPEPLLMYRYHSQNTSEIKKIISRDKASFILRRQLLKLGINPTNEEVEMHHDVSDFITSNYTLEQIDNWFYTLWLANNKSGKYKKHILLSTIIGRRMIISKNNIIKNILKYQRDMNIKEHILFYIMSISRSFKYITHRLIKKGEKISLDDLLNKIKRKLGELIIKYSINPRPHSYPFISGDSFRSFAKHIHDETGTFEVKNVKEEEIVFVKSNMLSNFFKDIHPKIQNKYILISHNSDENIDEKYSKYVDDKIIHWFTQNLMFEHPKISALPIGLENMHIYQNGIVHKFIETLKNKNERKNRILVGFSVGTNITERSKALDALKKCKQADIIDKHIVSHKYLPLLNKYRFVASPPGNGVDCIRTWEAITIGVVPICLNNNNTKHFKKIGAPILQVESFEEMINMSDYDLQKLYDSIIKESNFELKYFDYWKKLITSKISKQ